MFSRHAPTGFRIPQSFINGREGFLVFVIDNGSGIVQIEFLRLRHRVIVARASGSVTFY